MRRHSAALFLMAILAAAVARTLPAQSRWPSEGPPRPLPAHDVAFPPYEIRTLDNGLQVVAVLHHEQPVVSMRMLVRAGASLDPKGKAGLANMAASLLDQGTTAHSATEMNDAIDFIGGAMGAGAGPDQTFVSVIVMKDSFETGLQMLSDMARHPAFAPEEIERQRQQALSSLRVSFEDPEFLADAVFDRLAYGFHPYGLPQTGTPETLATITRDDLMAFHERNFHPNNAILAIVGDVTAEEAFEGVKKVFGDWPRGNTQRSPFAVAPDPTKRVVVVNKPDAVQTEVRVGHLGVKRNNSDYMALNLALRILGGEGANRLHQVLRTERGLTYGAKADMDALLENGDFEASTNTRSAATGEVLRLIVDEFWRLQRERVGERELSDAKAYITGSFPLTIETPDAIATQVLNVLFYGLPVQELQSFRDRVNAVRPEDIERVARFYLHPDRLSIVLVGNASAFVPQLRGLGFSNVEVIESGDLDLLAVNFRKANAAPATAPRRGAPAARVPAPLRYQSPETQAVQRPPAAAIADHTSTARSLLDEMIAAKGGLARLRAVKTLTVTTQARALGGKAPNVPLESKTYLEYPNHVRVESRTDRGDLLQVYDGSQAWVQDGGGIRDVPERMVSELEAGLKRDTIALLLAAQDGRVHARLLPDWKDEAGHLQRAIEFSGPNLDPTVLYVDPESHLAVRQTYVTDGMGSGVIEEAFDDYRKVDGIMVAFRAKVSVRGEPALERRVTNIVIDGALSPTLFKRPAS